MVSLCIDQGNSHTKVVLFEGSTVLNKFVFKQFGHSELQDVCDAYHPEAAILESVVPCRQLIEDVRRTIPRFVLLNSETPIPIRNGYDTPRTLGTDRLASAVGAESLAPGENLLVVDAGSAITFDVVTADGTFRGGNIAPGKRLRLNSLHDYTKRLPNVRVFRDDKAPVLGTNTEDAIRAGVVQGIAREIDGYIRWMQQEYGTFRVFITGGDAPIFLPLLESEVCHEDLLVSLGLKRILDYNLKKH